MTFLWAEPIWWQRMTVFQWQSMELWNKRIKKKGKFDFKFQNSEFISHNSEIISHNSNKEKQLDILSFPLGSSGFFPLRIDKLTIFKLNGVIKPKLGDINLHLRGKKSELSDKINKRYLKMLIVIGLNNMPCCNCRANTIRPL